MAIHPDYPGLKVEVEVNHEPLHEYQDDEVQGESRVVTRYIEAQSGEEFKVKYSFEDPFPNDKDVGLVVKIDGNLVDDGFCRKEKFTKGGAFHTEGVEVKAGSKWRVQRLCFGELRISK